MGGGGGGGGDTSMSVGVAQPKPSVGGVPQFEHAVRLVHRQRYVEMSEER